MKLIKESTTVLIATFSPWQNGKRLPINGNVEPLLDFFVPKTRTTVLIDQPYPGSDFVMPRVEVYEKGKGPQLRNVSKLIYVLFPFLKRIKSNGTHVVYKLRDFFSVFDCAIRNNYDLFIGLEAINGLAGIIMKRLGKIKCVVYYVSDYSPNRYGNKWFNFLYLRLDRFCAMHADYIWDVSAAIQPARISMGLDQKKSAPLLIVPNALYPAQISFLPIAKIEPFTLVFMGTLGEENGPDLAIKSLIYLVKHIPKIKLHLIGGGGDLVRLKKLTSDLKLEKYVVFHGFITDRVLVSQTIKKYCLALAPYVDIPGSARRYGDATKIRAYLAAGLPTITTSVPPLGKAAVRAGAALIVKDDPRAIASAVKKIFTNTKLIISMKEKAVAFARDNVWEKEFKKAIAQML